MDSQFPPAMASDIAWLTEYWNYKDSACNALQAIFPQAMQWRSLVPALGICAAVFAQSSSVDSYINTESPIAKAGVLANIGANGVKSSGAYVSPRGTDRTVKKLI
jgi:hypothetical protein